MRNPNLGRRTTSQI